MLKLFIVVFVAMAVPAYAANISIVTVPNNPSPGKYSVYMLLSGPIEQHDDGKFAAVLERFEAVNKHLGSDDKLLKLNSTGGYNLEANEIARQVRRHHLRTFAINTCDSACFTIFAAGVKRNCSSKLTVFGIHRSHIDKEDRAGRDAKTLAKDLAVIDAKQFAILKSFGIPNSVLDLMKMTPSGELTELSPSMLKRVGVIHDQICYEDICADLAPF